MSISRPNSMTRIKSGAAIAHLRLQMPGARVLVKLRAAATSSGARFRHMPSLRFFESETAYIRPRPSHSKVALDCLGDRDPGAIEHARNQGTDGPFGYFSRLHF